MNATKAMQVSGQSVQKMQDKYPHFNTSAPIPIPEKPTSTLRQCSFFNSFTVGSVRTGEIYAHIKNMLQTEKEAQGEEIVTKHCKK